MRDLEQVDGWEATSQQLRVDTLLDVAGKQEPPLADLAEEHDRDVVDRGPAVRRSLRNAVGVGPQDPEADGVEGQPIAG